jgi:hypothetical protein
MSTSNKNPFEIRLEILKMAKEMMDRQYEDQVNLAHSMISEFKEAGKSAEDYFAKYAPKMYDPKSIMDKAQELYGFVSKKD